jgi:uncharacterized protein CbrC (UPF0167 family)
VVEPLPAFRYHPDPIATGSIRPSPEECLACGRQRGFTYVGPVYAVEELDGELCPWCIADGGAARAFDAEFTDVGWGVPSDVPQAAIDEISKRTPGYSSWQQDHWLYHCGDGAAFLGRVGREELERFPDALETLRRDCEADGSNDHEITVFINALTRDGSPTAYLFRCLVCGRHQVYTDAD